MKKIFFFLLLFSSILANAQYTYQIVARNLTAADNTTSANIIGSGAAFHNLTWNVSGTVSGCSVRVDGSADGITWGTGDVIGATTCTSNGTTVSSSTIKNYVRINLVTITGAGATFTANLSGYITQPSGGGTLTSLTCGTGITCSPGSPITTAGTISSSGGSVACSTVTFSATPTFNGTGSTNCFSITLTGDVTSSTFSNGVNGAIYTFIVIQDSTGNRAFVPPTSMKQYTTWMATPSNRVVQSFIYDGTNLNTNSPWTIDTRPFTAKTIDEEFDGNTINTSSKWTWVNQGTSTLVVKNGYGIFSPQQGSNSFNLRYISQPVPSTPWTATMKTTVFNNGGNVNQRDGICVSDGTKLIMQDYAAGTNSIEVDNYSTTTSGPSIVVNSTGSGGTNEIADGSTLYLAVQDDGTNLNWSFSFDNLKFFQLSTAVRGGFLTTAPTTVGICGEGTNTAAATILLNQSVKWFRQTQ